MSETAKSVTPRREFIKNTVRIVTASALAGVAVPRVHAGEDNTIRLALIGCGGRGSGAVANAMSAGGLVLGDESGRANAEAPTSGGPVQLVAMADLLPERLEQSHRALSDLLGKRIDVPKERRFQGFDAYRKAIDCLRPGDVAMLTTHAAFRAPHLEYAIEKGVNVFMEKDFATDPGGVQRMLQRGGGGKEEPQDCRRTHGSPFLGTPGPDRENPQRRDGRDSTHPGLSHDPGYCMGPFPRGENELLWQLRPGHPYQFLWASGGIFIELMIHQIDECFWIKDSWPVAAHGVGGRFANSSDCSQNLDSYSIEYTFSDGTKAMVTGRYIPNCANDFVTYVHGTKCAAQFSGNIHAPTSQIYKDQRIAAHNVSWKPAKETVNPWQAEWSVLLDAIRNDRPHNECRRCCWRTWGQSWAERPSTRAKWSPGMRRWPPDSSSARMSTA